jgi:hypothetical protein
MTQKEETLAFVQREADRQDVILAIYRFEGQERWGFTGLTETQLSTSVGRAVADWEWVFPKAK